MLEGLFDQKELVLLLETARSDPAFHEQALGLDDGSGGISKLALWYTAGDNIYDFHRVLRWGCDLRPGGGGFQ